MPVPLHNENCSAQQQSHLRTFPHAWEKQFQFTLTRGEPLHVHALVQASHCDAPECQLQLNQPRGEGWKDNWRFFCAKIQQMLILQNQEDQLILLMQ